MLDVALVGFDKDKEVEVDGGFRKSLAIVSDISGSCGIELKFFSHTVPNIKDQLHFLPIFSSLTHSLALYNNLQV